MLLPGIAGLAGPIEFRTVLAGTIELRPLAKRAVALRTILARTRKPRTLIAATVVPRLVKASLLEISGAAASGARIAAGVVRRTRVPFLPGLRLAPIWTTVAAAEILARTPVARVALAIPGCATGKFLVAAEFSLGPIAARCVGSLFTPALARRIWPLVAEFLVGKA